MKKRVWLTMLEKDEERAKGLFAAVTRYGLAADGHFWVDDLDKMAWAAPLDSLASEDVGLWLVAGKGESFARTETRYGLAMLALAAEGRRQGLPILLLPQGDFDPASLPTPLAGAEIMASETGLGPKSAAKANLPPSRPEREYRATVRPLPGLGQWFEVGPAEGHDWAGAMFGLDQGEIAAHGVGPSGKVPEKTVLEYQMRGLTLETGGAEFTAWAVKNALTDKDSYYVQVKGTPETLLFGSFSEEDDAEMFRMTLV
jgi:hypothetical protein